MFFLLVLATLEMPKGSWYLHGVAQSTHYGKGLFLAKGYTNLICKLNTHNISYHLLSPLSPPSTTKCAHLHTPTSHLHTSNNGVYPRKNKRLVCVPLDHGFLTHGGEVGEGPKDISYILIKMCWASLRGSSLLCGHKTNDFIIFFHPPGTPSWPSHSLPMRDQINLHETVRVSKVAKCGPSNYRKLTAVWHLLNRAFY